MDDTTASLLTALVVIMSVVIIASLAALTVFVIYLTRLIKSIRTVTNGAASTLHVVRRYLLRQAGLLATLRVLRRSK